MTDANLKKLDLLLVIVNVRWQRNVRWRGA